MSTTEKINFLKDNLSNLDEGFLNVVYDMMLSQLNKKSTGIEFTESQKKELERRWELHKSGKSKSYTWEEVKQSIGAK
jgi:putative addiction module component (TIGR02574 family)